MYIQNVINFISLKSLTKADLARMAGVSRARVTQWFSGNAEWVNIETKTLMHLARSAGLPPSFFMQERSLLAKYEPRFLWDKLYPSMEHFIKALLENRAPAIARLVQVVGVGQAIRILGLKVVKDFDRYKKFIKPARRRQLEMLCPLYRST